MLLRLCHIVRVGLWLGATVFGGVTVAYQRIRERAGELGAITPEEVDGLYSLAILLPGPSFLNLWGAVCARAAGPLGAVAGQLALLTPTFVLVLTLPLLGRLEWLAARADGAMQAAVWATAGLLLATGVEGLRKRPQARDLALAGGSLAALLLGAHPVLVLGLV
ncbi:MAG TPA: chromate transporter, partial [Symbiobacteriaceae bacterium]|nr:chromate transporter [Symbiobacteriaceae bacterium]